MDVRGSPHLLCGHRPLKVSETTQAIVDEGIGGVSQNEVSAKCPDNDVRLHPDLGWHAMNSTIAHLLKEVDNSPFKLWPSLLPPNCPRQRCSYFQSVSPKGGRGGDPSGMAVDGTDAFESSCCRSGAAIFRPDCRRWLDWRGREDCRCLQRCAEHERAASQRSERVSRWSARKGGCASGMAVTGWWAAGRRRSKRSIPDGRRCARRPR